MHKYEEPATHARRRPLALIGLISGFMVLTSSILIPEAAFASSPDEPAEVEGLTAEQLQVIDAWTANAHSTSGVARVAPTGMATTNGMASTQATYSMEVSLYRGSWLAWADERVYWRYTGYTILSSSGYQSTGAIFPNNVTALGTSRISTTSSKHSWRGRYMVGAGVPTPWGNANVYNWTSTARIDVQKSGAYNGWWIN